MNSSRRPCAPAVIDLPQFDQLLEALQARGHTLVGPTIRDGAIIFDKITGARDLPIGSEKCS